MYRKDNKMTTILDAPTSEKFRLFIIIIILNTIGWIIFRLWYDVLIDVFQKLTPSKYTKPPMWMKIILAILFTVVLILGSIWLGVLPF